MLALGDAALSLCINSHKDIINNVELIGSACSNLKEVYLDPFTPLPALRALCKDPRPELVLLRMGELHPASEEHTVSLFQRIAETALSIERLHYYGPTPPADLMARFASLNRNLRMVEIHITQASSQKCPCRSSKVLDGSNESQNWSPVVRRNARIWLRCDAPARFRNTSVSICSYQYF